MDDFHQRNLRLVDTILESDESSPANHRGEDGLVNFMRDRRKLHCMANNARYAERKRKAIENAQASADREDRDVVSVQVHPDNVEPVTEEASNADILDAIKELRNESADKRARSAAFLLSQYNNRITKLEALCEQTHGDLGGLIATFNEFSGRIDNMTRYHIEVETEVDRQMSGRIRKIEDYLVAIGKAHNRNAKILDIVRCDVDTLDLQVLLRCVQERVYQEACRHRGED